MGSMADTLFVDEAGHDAFGVAADRRAGKFAGMERAASGGLQPYCRSGCRVCADGVAVTSAASDCNRDGRRGPGSPAHTCSWQRFVRQNLRPDAMGAGRFFAEPVSVAARGWLP